MIQYEIGDEVKVPVHIVRAELRVLGGGCLALLLNGTRVLFFYVDGQVLRSGGAQEIEQFGLKVDNLGKMVIG